MAKYVNAEIPLEWDELPLGYLARSYDGHLFEIDVNRYNGIAYVKYPAHLPTLRVVREVICALSDGLFFDDLQDNIEVMREREYCGFKDTCEWQLVMDNGRRKIVDPEGNEVDAWK